MDEPVQPKLLLAIDPLTLNRQLNLLRLDLNQEPDLQFTL